MSAPSFTRPVVISLNFSSPRRLSASPRSRTALPSPSESLVSSLQQQIKRLSEQVAALTQANSTLETQVLCLHAQLSHDFKSSSDPDSSLTTLSKEWKALEAKLLHSLHHLTSQVDKKSRRIRSLEDELRDIKKELETTLRTNRLLRIEVNTLKETMSKPGFATNFTQNAEKVTNQLLIDQLKSEIVNIEVKNAQKGDEMIAEIGRLKEKTRKMQEEMLEMEGNLFIYRVEKELRQ